LLRGCCREIFFPLLPEVSLQHKLQNMRDVSADLLPSFFAQNQLYAHQAQFSSAAIAQLSLLRLPLCLNSIGV
jgi:hypothetical protein